MKCPPRRAFCTGFAKNSVKQVDVSASCKLALRIQVLYLLREGGRHSYDQPFFLKLDILLSLKNVLFAVKIVVMPEVK